MTQTSRSRCYPADRTRPTLRIECLETRSLLSCVLGNGATLTDNTLTINGTNRGDVIDVQRMDNALVGNPSDDTLVVTLNGNQVANCDLADVTRLEIFGGNGHDRVTIGDGVVVQTEVNGGNGNDNLDGGDGDDTLIGGNGKDTLSGDDGNDLLQGGNSVDNLEGGAGDDRLEGGNAPDVLNDNTVTDDTDTIVGGNGIDMINGVLEPPPGRGRGHG